MFFAVDNGILNIQHNINYVSKTGDESGIMSDNKKLKIVTIVLAVLLGVSLLLLAGTVVYDKLSPKKGTSTTVSDNIITPDPEYTDSSNVSISSTTSQKTESHPADNKSDNNETSLSLFKGNPADGVPFSVKNMLPGDSETKNYCVKVSHKGNVTLKYHADIHKGGEKLSEVLKIKVVIPSLNKVIFDGAIKDMPTSLDVPLFASKKTESTVEYEITAYLETSVGNEYMNTELLADFKWWVEEKENLSSPQTGDRFYLNLWLMLTFGSLLFLVLLWKKCKKGEATDE